MPTLVSMIRGINVGGARPLRMEALRGIYEGPGFLNVRTYVQSGNIVCEARRGDSAAHAAAVECAILGDCGLDVSVAVRTAQAMTGVIAANPLLKRKSIDPGFLHATFLIGAKSPSLRGVSVPLGTGKRRPWSIISSSCIAQMGTAARRSTMHTLRRRCRSARPPGTGGRSWPLSGWRGGSFPRP